MENTLVKFVPKYDFNIPRSIESYLKKAITDGKNIIIGGETGVGKSTLLQELMFHIPEDSRSIYFDNYQGKPRLLVLEGNQENTVISDLYKGHIEESGSKALTKTLFSAMKSNVRRFIFDEINYIQAFNMYNLLLIGDTVLATIQSPDVNRTLQQFTNKVLAKNYPTLTENMIDVDLKHTVDVVIHINRSTDNSFSYISDILEYNNKEEIVIYKERF